MLNNLDGLQGALIGLAVLVFFVARQFSTRRIATRWTVLLPVALACIGLPGLTSLSATGWLLLSLNVSLGMALGFARGTSLRVWTDSAGDALMRGTALTAVLWLVTIAVRAGLAFAEVR